MAKLAAIEPGFYRISLPTVLIDSTHGEMRAFELNTVPLTPAPWSTGSAFLRAFQTRPLSDHIERVAIPDPKELGDEAIMNHCRRFVKTNYHPSGTCRMGPTGDHMAVLDPRLRVRGVEGLRVCDLSAMPNIDARNTNAPALMMGSRCAEFITAGQRPLPDGPTGR